MGGALGASRPNLKSDAEEGEVALRLDGATYTRRYRRRNGTVSVEGEPYTDDAAIVDLFVCLLEDNPARRAVERGDDLREIIMRPVEGEAIHRQIRAREQRKGENEEERDQNA
jgi:hypothetical protein